MTIAFKYRVKSADNPWIAIEANSCLELKETECYQIKFDHPVSRELAKELNTMGCEKQDEQLYAFQIINFAGELRLSSVRIVIKPSKFTFDSLSLMLEEISEVSSSLLFGWGTPTSFEVQINSTENNPPPYHQLQFLRQHILRVEIGNRLQDHFAVIEQSANIEIERNRKPVSLSRVKYLDSRAIQQLVCRPSKLEKIKKNSPLYESILAKKLSFSSPVSRHLPTEVWQQSRELSYNTLENQFVKKVIDECIILINRFISNKKLHNSMRDDCSKMLSILITLSDSNFLKSVGTFQFSSAPSQALLKLPGYREIFSFWMHFLQHRSLPLNSSELTDLLEGKNIALLYEYWVFMRINKSIARALGIEKVKKISVRKDELGERLGQSISVTFNEQICVHFNKNFIRSKNETYSTPLRPDVAVSVNGKYHIFDAKYKMTKPPFTDDSDYNEDERKELDGVYKRADLYKMHAYKDAIYNVSSAFVVYPGHSTVFFTTEGKKFERASDITYVDGVGAIALQPGIDDLSLSHIIRKILN